MREQNEAIREHARARFGDLLAGRGQTPGDAHLA